MGEEPIKCSGLYLGVDTGINGAFALIDKDDPFNNYRSHVFPRDEPNKLVFQLYPYSEHILGACVEDNYFGTANRKAAKDLHLNIGFWLGVLSVFPFPSVTITAQQWQKATFCRAFVHHGKKASRASALKHHSVDSAKKLFKSYEYTKLKDNHRADALHIALAAREYFHD